MDTYSTPQHTSLVLRIAHDQEQKYNLLEIVSYLSTLSREELEVIAVLNDVTLRSTHMTIMRQEIIHTLIIQQVARQIVRPENPTRLRIRFRKDKNGHDVIRISFPGGKGSVSFGTPVEALAYIERLVTMLADSEEKLTPSPTGLRRLQRMNNQNG